jgi:c-di-GMP-binding flagellar brake protein YcgR
MIELKIDNLYQAIEKKVSIELRRSEKSPEEVLFFSYFVQQNPEDNQQLLIDFPTPSAELEALKRDDAVVVKFEYKDSPYIFNSTVIGLTKYQLPGEGEKQGMIIEMPESIFGDERRSFLKVKTPPFEMNFKVSGSKDFVRQASKRTFEAVVLNISGGGIGIDDAEGKLNLSEEDVLDMTIQLPDQKLRMEGILLNIYHYEDTERTGFGIKFIQKNIDRPTFNKSQKAIVRYVMRRERELLSR